MLTVLAVVGCAVNNKLREWDLFEPERTYTNTVDSIGIRLEDVNSQVRNPMLLKSSIARNTANGRNSIKKSVRFSPQLTTVKLFENNPMEPVNKLFEPEKTYPSKVESNVDSFWIRRAARNSMPLKSSMARNTANGSSSFKKTVRFSPELRTVRIFEISPLERLDAMSEPERTFPSKVESKVDSFWIRRARSQMPLKSSIARNTANDISPVKKTVRFSSKLCTVRLIENNPMERVNINRWSERERDRARRERREERERERRERERGV